MPLSMLADTQLPEPIRTYTLMALLGILLLGMLLIVGILLGGHWVRRLGKSRRGPVVPPDVLPPQKKKQQASPESHSDQSSHQDRTSSGDTVTDGDTIIP